MKIQECLTGLRKVSLVLLFLLFGQGAVAQDGAAILQGTVKRPDGVPLSGATITALNLLTGQSHTTRSDAEGRFELNPLSPGEYEVRVSNNGLASQTPRGVKLGAGQVVSLNFTLDSGSPPQEQRSRQAGPATTGSRINPEQLAGLPLNGRSYDQLATLQAGVSDPTAASASRGVSGGGLNVVGGRNTANNYLLDGTNIMDTENNAPRSAAGVQLGSDAALQVQVFSSYYGAEYGRNSGGVLNSITRSGSNEFHGTLFEYLRNSKLDARNFFDGLEPPPFKRNQFGATFSGPIR
ncbi:MAG: carboxypeptidase regulatory-like domain-containing protein [Acidobacteria bacterium]|nr:carboxypeptidase regulatory-like domain-containing protein [Acidobacteriota bacterium]